MEIGNKIKILRKKAGFTQEQLASKLGISAQSISKWENEISMPDIMLLPDIAEIFGVSIDELFDLTAEQRFRRIENRIEIEQELSEQNFRDYESFLLQQLNEKNNRIEALSLLANLYHHRMESDSKRVSKYAREAILLDPTKKNCQWLLNKAEGHAVWDWNFANHSKAIEFYKNVIDSDAGVPKSSNRCQPY
jgi:transcriptional regulator with XRE-family HTH domain